MRILMKAQAGCEDSPFLLSLGLKKKRSSPATFSTASHRSQNSQQVTKHSIHCLHLAQTLSLIVASKPWMAGQFRQTLHHHGRLQKLPHLLPSWQAVNQALNALAPVRAIQPHAAMQACLVLQQCQSRAEVCAGHGVLLHEQLSAPPVAQSHNVAGVNCDGVGWERRRGRCGIKGYRASTHAHYS